MALVLLYLPKFLDPECALYLTIWRCRKRDSCLWRNQISCVLLKRLLWISPWPVGRWCHSSHRLSSLVCFPICSLHRKIEFPKQVKVILQVYVKQESACFVDMEISANITILYWSLTLHWSISYWLNLPITDTRILQNRQHIVYYYIQHFIFVHVKFCCE